MKISFNILLLLMLTGCAGMVTPSGGKKDEKIPVLEKSNLKPTDFTDHEIRLTFDENVQLESALKNISIQPKHTTLTVSESNRNIRIKLDSSLKPNTTYILDISGGIKDINEGNLYSMRYIFSTGHQIDTNYIEYKLRHGTGNKSFKIGLTNMTSDSVQKLKFDYLYRLNEDAVTIKGLGDYAYKCWIFTDKNEDDKPDEYFPVYYDTIKLNSTKNISLDPWTDYSNKKITEYKHHTKIFKPLCDASSYDNSDIVYIDKDSALFNKNNNDTLPLLDLQKELLNKINDRIQAMRYPKEYLIVLDKCGIHNLKISDKIQFKEDENFIFIYSKNKIDSLNLFVTYHSDSTPFCVKKIQYTESNKMSSFKVQKNDKTEEIIMSVYRNEKLISIQKIDRKNDAVFYMQPGPYKLIFYNTDSFIKTSFNYKKLQRVNCKIIEKEIILKPNWDEVFQLIFK